MPCSIYLFHMQANNPSLARVSIAVIIYPDNPSVPVKQAFESYTWSITPMNSGRFVLVSIRI